MKGQKALPFALLALGLAALASCGSEPAGAAPAAGAEPLALDGSRSYKERIVADAMRGLVYSGERVTVAPHAALAPDAEGARRAVARGYELIATNRRPEAIEAMTRAVLLAPGAAFAYEGLGDALVRQRKYPEAGASFRTGLALDPGSAGLRFRLADVLARAGDRDGAIEELRAAARLAPGDAKVRERLALQLYYTDRPGLAWAEVHRAEALGHAVPPQFRALLARRLPEPAAEGR